MPQAQLNRRLSSMDAAFLYFEKKEAPINIGSTLVINGLISFTEFKKMVVSKLPLLPRYRQKLVIPPFHTGHPTWEFDPDFDINRHVFEVTLEAPGTLEELRVLSGKLQCTMLDRSKPLWEIYLVNGLEKDRCALITKVHHAMADGISGVDLLEKILDSSPNPPPPPEPELEATPPPPRGSDISRRLVDSWVDELEEALKSWTTFQRNLLNLTEILLHEPDRIVKPLALNLVPTLTSPAPLLPFNKANTGQLELSWSEFFMDEAKAIRAELGGTVNDVVLTVLAGAVAGYLKMHHDSLAGLSMRLMVPVSMRNPNQNGSLGNLVSMLPVEIPLDLEDPLERYAFVVQETGKLKEGHVAEEVYLGTSLWGIVPAATQELIGSIADTPVPLVNTVCTNVPGPKVKLYALGKPVTHCYPYVPTAYHVGLSCAILSYDHKLFFGLTADAKAVPDLNQHFKPLLEQSFADLRQAAGVEKTKVLQSASKR